MQSITKKKLFTPARAMSAARNTQPRTFGESRYWGLVFISPWLIGLIVFKLIPITATMVLSFLDIYLLEPQDFQFTGLKNYIDVLKDPTTWVVFNRTLFLALLIIPLQTGASIWIAALLSNKKLLLKDTARALFFLPSIIPSTAFMFMWQGFVNPSSGWLSRILLEPFGLESLNIFAGEGAGQTLFILTTLWTIGPGILIIMGAIQGIPNELLEAARIDGAGRIRRFFSITLPLVTPAVFFTLVLNLTAVFGGSLVMDRGFNINAGMSSYDSYIHFVLFLRFELGEASSLAWVFFAFVILFVLILFGTSKRWVYFPDGEN
jgi:multiple sugar transport system permease protein